MSTADLKELVESLVLSQKETDRQMKENALHQNRLMEETDQQLKELGQQIGGLGHKFGSFAEGLSCRSIVRILQERFGMNDFVAPGVRVRRDGREEEYDVLAYTNDTIDRGMIVEIKSNLRREDIAQMKRKMEGVFQLLPEHRDKVFQGMIACVSGSADLKKQVLENGWYLAHIGDDLFELETPENFVAKSYSAESAG